MHPLPDSLACELRSAVLAGDHVSAERLATEYSQAVAKVWESLGPEERVTSRIPRQARELLAWAREMTVIQRALTAEHLAIVEKTIQYRPGARALGSQPTIEVQA